MIGKVKGWQKRVKGETVLPLPGQIWVRCDRVEKGKERLLNLYLGRLGPGVREGVLLPFPWVRVRQ